MSDYIKTPLENIFNVTDVITIHYFEYTPDFYFHGENHDFWELVYVDSGNVEVTANKEKHVLNQGDLIFHQPNEFHNIRALNVPSNVFIITFVCSSEAMQAFCGLIHTSDKNLRKYFGKIIEEAEKTFVLPLNNPYMKSLTERDLTVIGGKQMIKNLLEQSLIYICRKLNESRYPFYKNDTGNALAEAIVEYVKQNVYKRVGVKEICKQFGYSSAYLSRIFKEATGETMCAFSAQAKITEAKKLIREGKLSFAEIADLLKFDNPQYFSKVFRRISNMSPSAYKKSCQVE